MHPAYTVVINTSDSYDDCWDPFFLLFRRYWPDCAARVLLNTERKVFADPTGQVESSQVQKPTEGRLTWGECLLRCLSTVHTPLVLYMQEDYFLDARVDTVRLDALVSRMMADPTIRQIGLTAFGALGPFRPTDDPSLWEVGERSRYRTSLQAALWRTDTMRSYLRPDENGWMFEIFGSRRSWRRDERFLTVNRDAERHRRVLPYEFTGIVKGQWEATVPAFFAREGIAVDFSRRGFFHPRPLLLEKLRTLKKLMGDPARFVRGMLGR